ncbi:MAG: SsrA-binding protein SmpB [Acidobacteriota bacterium]|nr:MAG: SsrA-binding protein SmpB [Acidobacteriota bacterium]
MGNRVESAHVIAKNRKAFHEYEILERFEAGMVLLGTEVKSLRDHRVNLKEAYAKVSGGEIWLEGCNISPYSHGNITNHEPLRPRKLLLHKREISKLIGEVTRGGLTIVPLQIYLKKGKIKIEIALARGKKLYDKRETAKRKTIEREVAAELKRR